MPDEKKLAVFRVQKLTRGHGKQSLGRSFRHQAEHTKVAEISRPENLKNNKTLLGFQTYGDVKKFLHKKIAEHNKQATRGLRKDASIAFECIMTFSPDMADKINLKEWRKANLDFLKREFAQKGATVVRIDYHESEETPHIHAIFLSTTKDGKLSTKDFLGGRGDLSKLQDRYAKAMEQFKLERGYSRYNEYVAIRNMAIKAGYGKKAADVKAYCIDHGIPVPERKRHTTKYEWMAKLDERIKELKAEISGLEKQLSHSTTGQIIENLKKQKKQAEDRLEKLEKFVAQPNIARDWQAFLGAELSRNDRTNGGSIADDVLEW